MTADEVTNLLARRQAAQDRVTNAQRDLVRCTEELAQATSLPLEFRHFQMAAIREQIERVVLAVDNLERVLLEVEPVMAEFKARID